MTPLEKRIELMERKNAQLEREVAALRKEVRPAMPLPLRHGRYIGKTNADLTAGGTVDVTVWIWSTTDAEWQATATVIENVHEICLEDSQTLAAGSSVYIFYYENLWILMPQEFEGIIRFELTGTLSLSGHAPAETLEYAAGSWVKSGHEIEVYDWYGPEGMWNGISGYQGFCIRRPANYTDTAPDPDEVRPAYDIIWMERIAQIIQFTSDEYMGYTIAGQMQVTVNWYDHQGVEPVGTVIVRDPQGQFTDVFSGAKGTAQYDNHNGYYRIVSCQRVALFAAALLTADSCGSSMSIDGFVVRPTGDYVGAPPTTPTAPSNTCGHAGLDNDVVLLRRVNNTMPNPGWEVVDVSVHFVPVITNLRLTGTTLQYQTTDVYVERCESGPNDTWITWHTAGDECEEASMAGAPQSGEYEPSMPYSAPLISSGGDYGEAFNSPSFEANQ